MVFFVFLLNMTKDILKDYTQFILDFETLIRSKYKLSNNENIMSGINSLYERKGKIENYTYWFHGSGCSLEKNNIECHYDYFINDITFSLWNFSQFIITHPDYKNAKITQQSLEIDLYKLIEEGNLSWHVDGGIVWQVYQIAHR